MPIRCDDEFSWTDKEDTRQFYKNWGEGHLVLGKEDFKRLEAGEKLVLFDGEYQLTISFGEQK